MKHKRILGYSAIGLTLIAVGVAFIKPVSASNILFRARALNVASGTLTFSGSTVSGTKSVSTAITPTGGIVKCVVTNNDSSISSNYVAALVNGTTIRFYENDETTEFTFEDVDGFSLNKSNSTTYYSFTHYYVSTAGASSSFSWSRSSSASRSPNYQKEGIDVSQFWIVCTTANPSDGVAYLTSITINYNCAAKHQTGLSIDTAPTKTSYLAGESFDKTGMVVKAEYSNDTFVATTAYSVYPSVLSVNDTFVTISYGGFSDTQSITVSENTYVGTYVYDTGGTTTYTIELYGDMTGLYTYSGASTYQMHFNYSINGTSITFTKNAQAGDSQSTSGSLINLFTSNSGSTYENTNTGSFNNSGNIRVGTCSNSSISSLKTFTKQ